MPILRYSLCLILPLAVWAGVPRCCRADKTSGTERRSWDGKSLPSLAKILEEAGKIARRQGADENFWCERALALIAGLQKDSGDFDGALRSIESFKGTYCGRAVLVDVAEAMARAGRKKSALVVLNRLGADHGWSQSHLDDGVAMNCLHHQIAAGDLRGAAKAIGGLKLPKSRAAGLTQVAEAYAKAGNAAATSRFFRQALDASARIPDEYGRATALLEIADKQIAVGLALVGRSTILQLVKKAKTFRAAWASIYALRESGVRMARMRDRKEANRLFQQAIEGRLAIRGTFAKRNRITALNLIAQSQATAGYFDEALRTARLIKHSEEDFTRDGHREEALCAIAIARARAGEFDAALATALSIEHFVQYEHDALLEIIAIRIRAENLKAALKVAEKVSNPSKKATALLRVAAAYAKSGQKQTARRIAGGIRLTNASLFLPVKRVEFDYAKPSTWGHLYDSRSYSTATVHMMVSQRAQEVAAAAMTLAQVLGEKPSAPYAAAFKDILSADIVRVLARAHAETGDPEEAIRWAGRIGSAVKILSREDNITRNMVEQRIYALIGVAEGILLRQGRELSR